MALGILVKEISAVGISARTVDVNIKITIDVINNIDMISANDFLMLFFNSFSPPHDV